MKMVTRYLPLLSLWMIGPWALAAMASPTLKILTLNFNSEASRADVDGTLQKLRLQALENWIEQNSPDVIFMQEAWNFESDSSIASRVGRDMGYDVAYRLDMGFPGFLYDSDAVLAKKSLRMSDEQDIPLVHSAVEIGDGKTWVVGFGEVTYAVGVKLHADDGSTIYAYTTHLLGDTESDRADQIKDLDSHISATLAQDGQSPSSATVIIGADLNSIPGEQGISYLNDAGYADSWALNHPGDEGKSDCSDPTLPYFNPMTIGGDQFPAQNDENSDDRIDYVWVRSPALRPLAATLMFTAPLEGVWMSDHYGLLATLGSNPGYAVPNPARDSEAGVPPVVQEISDDLFFCPDAWRSDRGCERDLGEITVTGPRGATFRNHSSFSVDQTVDGPGPVFTSNHASMDAGEQAAFAFLVDGDYSYDITNIVQAPNPYRARLHGVIHVRMNPAQPSL